MECYTSRWKLLGLLGLTTTLVGACYFFTTMPERPTRFFGWFGVGFFGLGLLVFPFAFFRTGPQVIIDENGIEDRRWKLGVIPWEDIRSLSILEIQSTKMLAIDLVDPDKYLARLPKRSKWLASVNRALGLPTFAISFAGLTPGIKEVSDFLDSKLTLMPEADQP
jgi:hypothetical protein